MSMMATHIEKFKKYDKALNILGEDHKLQSRLLNIALRELNCDVPETLFYSFVNLPGGKMSTMYKNIQNQFGRGQQSLMGQLGKTMAGIEERYESEKERIKSERKRLSLLKGFLQKQADSWYLGKHAETVAKAGGLGVIPALINPGGD